MNVLIIGSGGREHALADAYSKSKHVKQVFVAPGNDFMSFQNPTIKTLPHVNPLNSTDILQAVKTKKIDLVDVAGDEPLAKGIVDKLSKKGIQAFGPLQNAAEIEWDKEWARQFMQMYHLPIPEFKSFTDIQAAISSIQKLPEQTLFIKASGLALGKGVIKTATQKEAIQAVQKMKMFGKSGETFLIEHALIGTEFSLFAICDGKDYRILKEAKDHKTAYEGDRGPNTGGMGCVSPITTISSLLQKEIEQTILKPFMHGMQKEGRPYTGILYLGGMLTKNGQVKIIEFNARWGDPEAEVILPGIQTDYFDLVQRALTQNLKSVPLTFDKKVRISIAGCARGYPGDYKAVVGKPLYGLEQAMKLPGITIYGAGIEKKGKGFVVKGGRIFHLVAVGNTLVQARVRAYGAMAMITVEGNNLHYRTDIGWREVERKFSI